jgi:hypothetical protein
VSAPENPPAIAITAAGDVYHGFDGMTLRDWFAGQALAGLLASPFPIYDRTTRAPLENADHSPALLAFGAYHLADAMLAERAKSGGAS